MVESYLLLLFLLDLDILLHLKFLFKVKDLVLLHVLLLILMVRMLVELLVSLSLIRVSTIFKVLQSSI